jgi:hypothetical protein
VDDRKDVEESSAASVSQPSREYQVISATSPGSRNISRRKSLRASDTPLTHSIRVSIILSLAAACFARDVKPPYTNPPYTQAYRTPPRKDPGVVCFVPDFSAYGPLVSGVTPVRKNSGPDYAQVKDAQKELDYCNKLQRQQEQWALNVLSCFDNPSAPMVQEVHWR